MNNQDLKGVSLIIKKSFTIFKATLLDRKLLFILPDQDLKLKPSQMAFYIQVLSNNLGLPVIPVIDYLESFQRRRYMKQRIPFLVPGKQLYIPKLLIDFNVGSQSNRKTRSILRPATQCMLYYHLFVESLKGKSQQQIANLLQYSEMTISRAVKELEGKELIPKKRTGLQFIASKKEIWAKAKPYFQSPIRKTIYTNRVEIGGLKLESGINALAHYTDISGEDKKTYAISQDAYKSLEEAQTIPFNDIDGDVVIEVWRYDPNLLSHTRYVDPLSLYMSMDQKEIDNRTSMALDQLLNLVLW